jgi:tRNA dimethylallyltransferase
VVQATGQSVLSFRKGERAKRDFNIIKIGLNVSKEQLHIQINQRVDRMMQSGLLEEVKNLQAYESLNALQTVGYRELFEYLHGNLSLEDAIELIKKNTRHYAKRQLTWFKKDPAINWFHTGDSVEIIKQIKTSLQQ